MSDIVPEKPLRLVIVMVVEPVDPDAIVRVEGFDDAAKSGAVLELD